MAASFSSSDLPPRLANRLATLRQRQFVGRVAELELFRTALQEASFPFALLHVFGPGGIGKTTLLREYQRVTEAAGIFSLTLDGRNVDSSPTGFLLALSQILGLNEQTSPLQFFAEQKRLVLFLDTYDMLTSLDTWLRDSFLPQLPEQSLVVIAGRNTPASAWSNDLGWRDLVRVISLRNLGPDESRTYLSIRGVPTEHCQAACEFTHGHPLALSLISDILLRSEKPAFFSPEHQPDMVRVLLERFLEQEYSSVHRQALEVCAHVRVTTESLLAETLDAISAPEAFEWLRGLSFIEQGPEGLFPHDLVREILDSDLRWRNFDSYQHMHLRARAYIVRKLQATRGLEQQRSSFDLLYLHRNNPIMKPYYDWKTLGHAYAELATERDTAFILEQVRRYEGDASANIMQYWLKRQPQAFRVFRGQGNDLLGFMATLVFSDVTEEECVVDPALDLAWRFALRYGPVRPGEECLYHRSWMGHENYQEVSAAYALISMESTIQWLTRPRLAWNFLAVSDPDFWMPIFTHLNFQRSSEADFAVGERHFAVFTHDWRAEPALTWLELMAQRELNQDLQLERPVTERAAPLLVLSQPEFKDAVRQVLRNYHRPAALAANPLLRSRLAAEQSAGQPKPTTLQELIKKAVCSLKTSPRDERLYRALMRTYIEPAPTQEVAAEVLGLPFSTYRFHLTTGIERVIEWCWHHERFGFSEAVSAPED